MIRKSEYEIQKDLENLGDDLDDLSTTVDSKTSVDDTSADSADTTYSASKIEELISEIPSGGVEEAPIDTKQYGRKDAGWTEITAGGHTQNTDTGLGTLGTKNPPIDADKAIYRDSTASDGLVTSTWTQIKAFLKTYFDGIYAVGTIPVKASAAEVNTGSDDAKFVTALALLGSGYLDNVKATSLTDIADSEIDLANHSLILIDANDGAIKKITFANLKKYLDTIYTPL